MIIHVGYPKTATTYLQQAIFPFLDAFTHIDYYGCRDIFDGILFLDDLDYDASKTKRKLATALAGSDGKPGLFSLEGLSGVPYGLKGLGRSDIPDRLKEVGFSKIIITVRRQEEMIDSLFRQYVVQGGVLSFRSFLYGKKLTLHERMFYPGYLHYYKLIELYQKVFGMENVLVLPQEMLKEDGDGFMAAISEFMGIEPILTKKVVSNRSLTNFSIGFIRWINIFTYSPFHPRSLFGKWFSSRNVWKLFLVIFEPYFISFFARKRSFLKAADREFVRNYYAEGNQQLQDLVPGIDWTAWGYK